MPKASALVRELGACLSRDDAPRALELFASTARAPPGGPPPARAAEWDTTAYNRLLALLQRRHDDAAEVRAHMAAVGVPADETTLTLDIRRLVATGEVEKAAAVLDGAKVRHQSVSQSVLHNP